MGFLSQTLLHRWMEVCKPSAKKTARTKERKVLLPNCDKEKKKEKKEEMALI